MSNEIFRTNLFYDYYTNTYTVESIKVPPLEPYRHSRDYFTVIAIVVQVVFIIVVVIDWIKLRRNK